GWQARRTRAERAILRAASLALLCLGPLRRLGRPRPGRALAAGRGLPWLDLALFRLALPGLFRRRGLRLGRSGARSVWCVRCGQHRRLTLGALRRDDDGVRETFGPAVVAEDLVCLGAARALEGDLLELVLELLLGELPALEPCAGLDHFLDVELEDVAPPELALGSLAPSKEHAEPASTFLQGELDLLADLVVVGDSFLRLAGEGHPYRRHVDEDDHGPGGQR